MFEMCQLILRKMMPEKNKIIVVTGPTATGKTTLAVKLAATFGGEIISVDSRQVYRGMDIGTGKDLNEYNIAGKTIPCHLVDVVDPQEDYNLMRYCQDARQCLLSLHEQSRLPILCGGTALYLDALLSNYQLPGAPPNAALRERLAKKNTDELLAMLPEAEQNHFRDSAELKNRNRLLRRLERSTGCRTTDHFPLILSPLILGVYYPRTTVHRRIEQRLDRRLAGGMIEEVQHLHAAGISWERLEFFGLEYRCIAEFLQGKTNFDEMHTQLFCRIRQFAKRQDIWFRKMERAGKPIHWLPQGDFDSAVRLITDFLADRPLPSPVIQLKDINYGNTRP